jgi:hypothetical protein
MANNKGPPFIISKTRNGRPIRQVIQRCKCMGDISYRLANRFRMVTPISRKIGKRVRSLSVSRIVVLDFETLSGFQDTPFH